MVKTGQTAGDRGPTGVKDIRLESAGDRGPAGVKDIRLESSGKDESIVVLLKCKCIQKQ